MVFPIHFMTILGIVRRFCFKLKGIEKAYIFTISIYGGEKGNSIPLIKKELARNGGRLSAIIGIQIPQNSFCKRGEDVQKTLFSRKKSRTCSTENRAKRKIRLCIQQDKRSCADAAHAFPEVCMEKIIIKEIGWSPDLSMNELVNRIDDPFFANKKCNGCGPCSRGCPGNNILFEEGRPKGCRTMRSATPFLTGFQVRDTRK